MVPTPEPQPENFMIKLVDLRYVHLGASSATAASKWAQEIYGLEEVAQENGRIYLRGDDRDHNICYFDGDPKDNTVGIEVADYDALDQAASRLEANGVQVTWGHEQGAAVRRCMKYLTFNDPTGNKFDLLVRPFASANAISPAAMPACTGSTISD